MRGMSPPGSERDHGGPSPAAEQEAARPASSPAAAGRSARVAPSAAEAAFVLGIHGNRDLARLVAGEPRRLQRNIRTIRGERVSVHNDRQEREAGRIIDQLENDYGIDIDSSEMVTVVRARYSAAPGHVRRRVHRRHWKLRELRALRRAAGHYARILGAERATSSRHADAQEVSLAGKLSTSINDARTAADVDTLGEYFRERSAFAMYRSGENDAGITGDVDQELEFTATHELAHGLMNYALASFIARMDYWLDRATPSGAAGAEAPPTDYGQTNAAEDMCETMAMYFMFPDRLRTNCPVRYRWARRKVRNWRNGPPAAAPAAPVAAPAAAAAAAPARREADAEAGPD
jgi:hypothetical protein